MVGYSGAYIDIPTEATQTGRIIFTQSWPGENHEERWLGRNVEIEILPAGTLREC
jgi:glucoamylase